MYVLSKYLPLRHATRIDAAPQLLDIRLGPGAVILPPEIKRLHLSFAYKINDGHRGARQVWRNHLPRLKYHNPAVSMTIDRSHDQAGPATLSIFFAPAANASTQSATASPAPTSSTSGDKTASFHTSWDRVEAIDMKHKKEEAILERLMEVTHAQAVMATAEEEVQLRDLEEQRRNSERVRENVMAYNEKARQERALLEQARGELA